MEGTHGKSAAAVRKMLLEQGRSFSFFQAMRLLGNLKAEAGENRRERQDTGGTFRARPNLSLAFAGSDVEGITESASGKLILTANILGLYGTGSPLPVFYTEDLFEGGDEEPNAARDFLDVINHRLYELLYAGWAKYQVAMKVIEEEDGRLKDRMFSVSGLGHKSLRKGLPHSWRMIRYSGLLSQGTRSASGLEILLSDALDGVAVEVVQAVKRLVPISFDQRCVLGVSGNIPGDTCYLGDTFEDSMGAVLIRIGPLSEASYRSLLPGTDAHQLIVSLTRFYLSTPIEFIVEVVMGAEEQKKTAHLGEISWSQLGLDTWLFSGEPPGELSSRFYPETDGVCPSG
ncbi:type VI secretion system baseplate subunit TssG [Desulfoluna sp.]|uniref:type VI secretion system baseplate subunit TssG n=1 Tax=Desulfoluna sp. TaxID=2045199 RepID=UPI00261562D2|nr:type VI secretion system baseplate subunit TssG [Desulfoluna sp.]